MNLGPTDLVPLNNMIELTMALYQPDVINSIALDVIPLPMQTHNSEMNNRNKWKRRARAHSATLISNVIIHELPNDQAIEQGKSDTTKWK